MSNDLPLFGFDHAFHSDVIMTLVFFNDRDVNLDLKTNGVM